MDSFLVELTDQYVPVKYDGNMAMAVEIIASVAFAEGYTILRNEISLHNVLRAILWRSELSEVPYTFWAFVSLLDTPAEGDIEVVAELVRGDETGFETLAVAQGPATKTVAPGVRFALVCFEAVHFQAAGRYTVNIAGGDTLVAQEPLFVVEVPGSGDE